MLGPLAIRNGSGGFALKLTVPKTPAELILVFGSPPRSPGTRRCKDFRFLGLLPAPVGGESDLTELWVKKFGNLPAGARVFILIRRQMDGWRDIIPAQLTAVVPNLPDPGARRKRR